MFLTCPRPVPFSDFEICLSTGTLRFCPATYFRLPTAQNPQKGVALSLFSVNTLEHVITLQHCTHLCTLIDHSSLSEHPPILEPILAPSNPIARSQENDGLSTTNRYSKTYTYIPTHTHTHTYIYIYKDTYIHIYIYIYTYLHTYIHTYIYIYIHVYIHCEFWNA